MDGWMDADHHDVNLLLENSQKLTCYLTLVVDEEEVFHESFSLLGISLG